jgi:hypothetical protein
MTVLSGCDEKLSEFDGERLGVQKSRNSHRRDSDVLETFRAGGERLAGAHQPGAAGEHTTEVSGYGDSLLDRSTAH